MIVDAPVRRRQLGEIGFQPGQCPALDTSYQTCLLNGSEMPCSFIRECDPYTGAVHFEYALPYGSQNVNIWDIAGNQAYWLGPNPMPEEQPVFPDYVTQAYTFGNTQLLSAPSVPVVTASQSSTSGTNTAPPQPTNQPIAPATPPAGSSLTEVATRVWKQITAGDASASSAGTSAPGALPWYHQIPWWAWVIVAAGAAYTTARTQKQ